MTDTEALRRAIELADSSYGVMGEEVDPVLVDAARRWLALAEGDEAIMKRLKAIIGETFIESEPFRSQEVAHSPS